MNEVRRTPERTSSFLTLKIRNNVWQCIRQVGLYPRRIPRTSNYERALLRQIRYDRIIFRDALVSSWKLVLDVLPFREYFIERRRRRRRRVAKRTNFIHINSKRQTTRNRRIPEEYNDIYRKIKYYGRFLTITRLYYVDKFHKWNVLA